jgi:hypothetical protein
MYAQKHGRSSGAGELARDVLMRTMHAKQPALGDHSTVTSQPPSVLLRSTSGRRLRFSHAVWDVRQRIAGVPTG